MANTFFTQRLIIPNSAGVFSLRSRNPNALHDLQAVWNNNKIELHVLEDKDTWAGGGTYWSSGYTQIFGVVVPGTAETLYQTGSGGVVTHGIAELPEGFPGVPTLAYTRVIVLSDGRVTWHVYLAGIAK